MASARRNNKRFAGVKRVSVIERSHTTAGNCDIVVVVVGVVAAVTDSSAGVRGANT
jgi:hypothetical protein